MQVALTSIQITVANSSQKFRKWKEKNAAKKYFTWLAKPWSGPAKPFNAAANER